MQALAWFVPGLSRRHVAAVRPAPPTLRIESPAEWTLVCWSCGARSTVRAPRSGGGYHCSSCGAVMMIGERPSVRTRAVEAVPRRGFLLAAMMPARRRERAPRFGGIDDQAETRQAQRWMRRR